MKSISAIVLADRVALSRKKPSNFFWREISKSAKALKAATTNTEEKNWLWIIQTFANATAVYLDAYRQMSRGQFMEGWCTLEEAELGFARLADNAFIESLVPLIDQRAELIALWQSLFPYRHFVSPGMRYKKWACSICGKQSTPIDPCGHIQNRVYGGELCFRRLEQAEPLEVSIVTISCRNIRSCNSIMIILSSNTFSTILVGHFIHGPVNGPTSAIRTRSLRTDRTINRARVAPSFATKSAVCLQTGFGSLIFR